jgi:hypothetical protein
MRVTIEHDDGQIDTFDLTIQFDEDDNPSIKVEQDAQLKPRPERHDVLEGNTVNGTSEPEEGPDDEVGQPEPPVEGELLNPQCFLCENFIGDTDTDSLYCFGCRTFICPEHPQTPWGTHMPDDHDKP